jgi:hypothetical protein
MISQSFHVLLRLRKDGLIIVLCSFLQAALPLLTIAREYAAQATLWNP